LLILLGLFAPKGQEHLLVKLFHLNEASGRKESMKFSRFFIVVGLSVLASQVQAEELKSRQVVGGDLVFSAEALGKSQDEALFRAESQSVRMLTIECSIPHRDTKIFSQSVIPVGNVFQATVVAGLPLETCEKARSASPEQKQLLTNATLASAQRIYELMLEGEKIPQQPPTSVARVVNPQPASLAPVRYVFSQQFMTEYEKYLFHQVDRRESIRKSLTQSY
jgi:hypothetical protein